MHPTKYITDQNIPPTLGEVRMCKDMGLSFKAAYATWIECPICHNRQWKSGYAHTPYRNCSNCAGKIRDMKGEHALRWNGGIFVTGGYRYIRLKPDDFFYPMVDKDDYVAEHRLVYAKFLGRCLWEWELVHHINDDKLDNRIENLELSTRSDHAKYHYENGNDWTLRSGLNHAPDVIYEGGLFGRDRIKEQVEAYS